VVESSLGVPTGCAGKLRWQTDGMFSEAAIAEPWDGVGKAVMAGTHSSSYHPLTDGQTERVNEILEDMLKACVMDYPGSWDKNLPWVVFSYNNSYQVSLKMALLEVLHGSRCHTSLNWIELGDNVIFGPNIVDEAEVTVCRIQDNLRAAKSCQESYANKRR
jgi:hypothetical protein